MTALGWRWLAVAMAVYIVAWLGWRPTAPMIVDETTYINQAVELTNGRLMATHYSNELDHLTLPYPPGTSALIAGLHLVGGVEASFVLGLLGLLALVMLTAMLLRDAGYGPAPCAAILTFPPALVLGRTAMSDLPTAALVAASCLLFFRDQPDGRVRRWLAAGFLAGLTSLFREAQILLFVGLFGEALLRRERGAWALVVGSLLGCVPRAVVAHLASGSPLGYRPPQTFALDYLFPNLLWFGGVLLLLLPGALLALATFRGKRHCGVIAGCALMLALHLVYRYTGAESAFLKRLVLGGRFVLPFVPLVCLALAERFEMLEADFGARRVRWLVTAWGAAALVGCCLVHPIVGHWSASQQRIRSAILTATEPDAVVVTNWQHTRKHLTMGDGRRYRSYRVTPARQLEELEGEPCFIAFLYRDDSPIMRASGAMLDAYVAQLPPGWRVVVDQRFTSTDRVVVLAAP